MTHSDTPHRYTREQTKLIRAMQGGAMLWVAGSTPFLTDPNAKVGRGTRTVHRKVFNTLLANETIYMQMEDKSRGITQKIFKLTKKGIAVKCQR